MSGTISVTDVDIECIAHREDARLRSDDDVAALADSIAAVGLLNPIRVRRTGSCGGTVAYEVVAGSHRLQACELLGWRKVACIISADDDLHAELAMIDENLCRAELSPVDRAKQTARRKAIYLQLHPETARQATLKQGEMLPSRQLGETARAERFTEATARVTGQSERAVQRDAERGEKVVDEAINLIRGTKLETGAYLDKLKKLSPNDQVQAAKRDLTWEKQRADNPKPQGGVAGRYEPAERAPSNPTQSAQRFISLADQIEAIPLGDLVASGRLRATVGQRAEGVASRMDQIKERLNG